MFPLEDYAGCEQVLLGRRPEKIELQITPITLFMYTQRPGPRKEYRQAERERINASASLAETFHDLRALTVDLAYFSPGSFSRNSEIKYTVNLTNAKSLFHLSCPNDQCVGGDFDLSAALATAVSKHQTKLIGEVICQGWRSETEIGLARCQNALRYKLSAEYAQHRRAVGPAKARELSDCPPHR